MRKFAFPRILPGAAALIITGLSLFGMSFASSALAAAPVAASAAGSRQIALYHGKPRITNNGTASSTNWSGYAVTGANGAFTDVKATWVQPTATCGSRKTAYSSFWVGLDGYSSNSVEQLGTDSDCSRGRATYYGWWEMYPNPSMELSTSSYRVSPAIR